MKSQGHLLRRLSTWMVGLVVLLGAASAAEASHFRHGTISWRRVAGRTVEFTVTSAWRTGAVEDMAPISLGNGQSLSPLTAATIGTGVDAAGDAYTVRQWRRQFTYASDGPFTVQFNSCCRIGGLANAGGSETINSVVDLRGGDSGGPVSSIPAIIQFPKTVNGNSFVFPLAIGDPDGDGFTCRLSTPQESQIATQPSAGGKPLIVTNNCELQWDTSSTAFNQRYAVQVMITTTRPGSTASTALDFILEIVNQQLNAPPACQGGGNFITPVGVPFSQTFTGNDADGGTLTMNAQGVPAGATFAPPSGSSGAVPFANVFNWTPQPADQGQSFAVSVVYRDPGNFQAVCSMSLTVPAAPINRAPIAQCANVTTTTAPGTCGAAANINNGSSDPDGDPITCVQNPLGPYSAGSRQVTLTCTDPGGLSGSCIATVTVTDPERPQITCPAAVVAQTAPGTCGASPMLGTAIGSDNCGPTMVASDAPNVFGLGNTTVTWLATDGSGNTVSCTQLVTIRDAEAPQITCPPAITTTTAPGTCGASPPLGMAMASDNCAPPQVGNNAPKVFGLGETVVVWTAVDPSGNASSCTQTITVRDAEAPAITCPPSQVLECIDLGAVATWPRPVTSDNCGGETVACTPPRNTKFPLGMSAVTCTATDRAGLKTSCPFGITVRDTLPPVVTDKAPLLPAPGKYCTETVMLSDCASVKDQCVSGLDIDAQGEIECISLKGDDGKCAAVTARCKDEGKDCDKVAKYCGGPGETDKCTKAKAKCARDGKYCDKVEKYCEDGDRCVDAEEVDPKYVTFNGGQIDFSKVKSIGSKVDHRYVVYFTVRDGNGNSTQASCTIRFDDTKAPKCEKDNGKCAKVTDKCNNEGKYCDKVAKYCNP